MRGAETRPPESKRERERPRGRERKLKGGVGGVERGREDELVIYI